MSKLMKSITILSFAGLIGSIAFLILFANNIFVTFAITFGTTFYHLAMRLFVGWLFNKYMGNHADLTKGWYRTRPFEIRLYQFIRVKKWKERMPTYDHELFSPQAHTWNEIAQAMCQAELVHDVCFVLSFVPIIAVKWFGAFWIFLITSVLSAAFDLAFVIMQRYNRARIVRIASRKQLLNKN